MLSCIVLFTFLFNYTLRWRHNGCDSVSNHQPHHCLLNRLFRRRSKKTSKLRVTGLCAGNSPGPVNSPHKWPVTRKMFPFDEVIMKYEKQNSKNYDSQMALHIEETMKEHHNDVRYISVKTASICWWFSKDTCFKDSFVLPCAIKWITEKRWNSVLSFVFF